MHQLEPTKERIDRLIDSLADKSLTFGCMAEYGGEKYILSSSPDHACDKFVKFPDYQIVLNGDYIERQKDGLRILGHPVRIGDVLAKLYNEKGLYDMCTAEEILDEWRKCGAEEKNGLLLSLQEIFDCEWLGPELNGYEVRVGDEKENYPLIFPEDPNIRALASLLLTLFPDV